MKILTISKLKKVYKIEFENGEWIYLNEDTIIKFNLFKSKEISDEEVEEIQKYDKNESAYSLALNYLSYSMRTEHEIAEYLLKKEFEEENIVFVIQKLRKNKYIDDKVYAETYTRDRFTFKLKGPEYIRKKLQEKKINAFDIEEAIFKVCSHNLVFENVYKLIEKEYVKIVAPENKKIQKITTKLYTNGYSFDIIKSAFDRYISENQEDNEDDLLEKHYNKAYLRLSRKYADKYTLKQKIIEKLLRDGFKYDNITDYLSKIEF